MIGLIKNEIERDLAQRAAMGDCESIFGDESEESEDEKLNDEKAEDLDDEQDESVDQGMSMGM